MARIMITLDSDEYVRSHGMRPGMASRKNGPGAWMFHAYLNSGPVTILTRGTFHQAHTTAREMVAGYARIDGTKALTLTVCP